MSEPSQPYRPEPPDAHAYPGPQETDKLLERSSSVPLYFQLAEILKERIEAGRWRPGDRLPSERDITREFGVSRTVIRPALDLLESDGQIIRMKGRGVFVTAPKTDTPMCGVTRLLREHRSPDTDILVLSTAEQHADESVVQLLDATQDNVPIEHCTAVVRRSGKPLWMCTSFIAIERVPWLSSALTARRRNRITADDDLGSISSPQLVGATATVSTAFVTEWEAIQLKMSPGGLCFLTRYVEHARVRGVDRPVEFARIVHRADAVQLKLDLGQSG